MLVGRAVTHGNEVFGVYEHTVSRSLWIVIMFGVWVCISDVERLVVQQGCVLLVWMMVGALRLQRDQVGYFVVSLGTQQQI
jgi:hypothetical protein